MKKKLLVILFMCTASLSFGQFSTGTVTLGSSAMTVKIDTNTTTATLTLTGPTGGWFGIGFGGNTMDSVSDMFIWNSTANRDYTPSGFQSMPSADAAGSQSWTVTSDNVVGTTRTVVATRALVSAGDFTFTNNTSSISIIYARGSTTALAAHGSNPHAAQTLTRTALGVEDFSLNASAIYPNPSKGNFKVKSKTTLDRINIYTQTGAFVKTIEAGADTSEVEVNAEGMATGVYMIELQNATDKSWKKIIIN